MSLLNEMLHDLAKKKPADKVKATITATLSNPRSRGMPGYLSGGIALFALIFVGIITSRYLVSPITSLKDNTPNETKLNNSEKIINSNIELTAKKQLSKSQAARQILELEIKKALIANNKIHINNDTASLKHTLAKEPDNIEAREQLATIQLSIGQLNKALKVVNLGLEYAPENPIFFTLKAKVLIVRGQSKAAAELLKSDHPSMVNYPDFYATLASALVAEGNYHEATTYYKSLIKVHPNNSRYWLGYGLSLEKDKQLSEAINAYTRASQSIDGGSAMRKLASRRLNTLPSP